MRGSDLVQWRNRFGYSQARLMKELGVKSRQTVTSWEKAEELPRLVELALAGLESTLTSIQQLVTLKADGKSIRPREAREYFARRVKCERP
jgi:DNA-binding XRE family transcriptional regulator